MQLYLVQHAQSLAEVQDPERPLSEEGRAAIRRSAELVSRLGVEVAEIRHSDKLRAVQTAEELEWALQASRRQVPGLGPNDPIDAWVRELASTEDNLLIVGHLPFLERLTSFLLCGDPNSKTVEFENAGVIRLDRHDDGRWSLRWAIPPRVLANTDIEY